MSEPAIRVDHLGKKYRIGVPHGYGTLREALASATQAPVRLLRGIVEKSPGEFWALKDVSFQVEEGEVLGIIGNNGAGKSTLLKILSRVTHPTTGRAQIWGRVGSLLEVGTGFHPELTGRENIYLNGAILGMRKSEIRRKFDQIVDFADVERFLDTPVKRYSSGMYMRLAFAVAAHLEPQILIVDEVLAVGDAAFQKKCLGKMKHVAGEGRTVLFVSHNMAAVLSLCNRALLLRKGELAAEGRTSEVVQGYLDGLAVSSTIPLDERTDRSGDGTARITSLRIESTDTDGIIRPGSRLKLTIGYRSARPLKRPQFVVTLYDQMNVGIYLLHNDFVGGLPETLPPEGKVVCLTDPINLTPGRCVLGIELLSGNVRTDNVDHAGAFDVETDDVFGSGMVPPRDWVIGILKQEWRLETAEGLEK